MSCTVDYTNDPSVVGMIDNFMSINNAVEIDLFGQVNSESSEPNILVVLVDNWTL